VKMSKTKTLVLSVIMLALSIAILVGATLALFSDVALTQRNVISTADLEVGLYHENADMIALGEEKKDVEAQTNLFAMPLWEPNASVYERFTVVNEGDVTVGYKFSVNVASYNKVAGSDSSLADVLKVAVVSDPSQALADDFDGYVPLKEFQGVEKSNFAAAAQDVFYVVITWDQSAYDNNLNLRNGLRADNGDGLYIDIGVRLIAWQGNGSYDGD